MPETVWMYDDPTSSYHDIRCECSGHCVNCRTPLTGRQRLYCSTSCGRRWRAEGELDRRMQSYALEAVVGRLRRTAR